MKLLAFISLLIPLAAPAGPRLVSTSPEVTELLFELGRGPAVVATSDLSHYPEAAKAIPRLGPLFTPSIERALRFSPDWALLDEAAPVPLFAKAAGGLGLRLFTFRVETVPMLFAEAERLLREVFGENGSPAIDRARHCWERRSRPAREIPFLAFVWLDPPILFGPRTFLSSLLEGRGGRNLLPTAWGIQYPQVSEEWLLRRRPEALYVLDDTPDAEAAARRAAARWWPKGAGGAEVRPVVLSRHRFARATLGTVTQGMECDAR